MTAKEYLRQLLRRDARINALIERQQRYRELAGVRGVAYGDVSGGGSRHGSAVEDYAVRIVELEREIDRRIDEYVDLVRQAEAAIDQVEDERCRDVLRYRYLNGWSWEKIAEQMHYDERWVRRLHGRALARIEIPESAKHARESQF